MRAKMKNVVAVAAVMVSATVGWARGAGVDPKYIPADAKWVVHVNVDNLARSQTYDLVLKKAEEENGPGVGEKLAKFGEALGMRFPDDLHGVTLVGRGFDEKSAVLVVQGKLDKDRVIGMAKMVNGYASTPHGGVEVSTLGVPGGGQSVSGAFLADDVLVLGRTVGDVNRMLDLSAGKEKAVGADRLLAGTAADSESSGVMLYLAAEGLAELQKKYPVSPILAQVTGARVSVAEKGDDAVVKAVLHVTSPELGKQVKGALEGLRALVGLAALDDSGDEQAKAVAAMSQRATVTAEGTVVTLDWPMALGSVKTLIEMDKPGKVKHGKGGPKVGREDRPDRSQKKPQPENEDSPEKSEKSEQSEKTE